MPDVYGEAYYHLIWATARRERMVVPRIEDLLYDYIRRKCREKQAFVYALGGMPDHVHLACSIPASLAVAEFAQTLKGSSSHYINHRGQLDGLRWQRGYSYLTFAKRDLLAVVAYIEGQKQHHADGKLWPKLERLPTDED
jgi:REP element-mobilizing transposase RayT